MRAETEAATTAPLSANLTLLDDDTSEGNETAMNGATAVISGVNVYR
jgi:hypothetical protein